MRLGSAVRATLLAVPVGLVIGSACALFLWSLDLATRTRFAHPALLYFLPLAGIAIDRIYALFGRSAEAGTNLILEEIHEPRAGVPRRMAPLILISTVITHLFGGSAGREGTAVQIGGGVASTFGRWIRLPPAEVRMLLRIGIAAGFGGVFGTPIAGAIFALEVVIARRLHYEAVVPCVVAAFVSDFGCTMWGIHHVAYSIAALPRFDLGMLGQAVIVGGAAGLASAHFVWLTHALHTFWRRAIPLDWLRPAAGGVVIIGLTYLVGTRDYLGLGVISPDAHGVSIVASFHVGGATAWIWWWKIAFTAVTLSCGYKGGEVTPLFFIGATLGNALSNVVGGPVDWCAGLGFVAVFAGATKTPLACAVMGMELFGATHAAPLVVACYAAFAFAGRGGIYATRRRGGESRASSVSTRG